MEPLPALAARKRPQRCAFCSATGQRAAPLGLEPTSLERETHDPDCPLLDTRRPLRLMLPLFALAIVPAFTLRTCSSSAAKYGLDDGTVSMPDDGDDQDRTRTG